MDNNQHKMVNWQAVNDLQRNELKNISDEQQREIIFSLFNNFNIRKFSPNYPKLSGLVEQQKIFLTSHINTMQRT